MLPGDAVPSPDLSTTPPRDPTSKYYSITKSLKQAIEKLPDLMSKGKTSDAMTKYKKRTILDMNGEIFNDQAIKGYYDTRLDKVVHLRRIWVGWRCWCWNIKRLGI